MHSASDSGHFQQKLFYGQDFVLSKRSASYSQPGVLLYYSTKDFLANAVGSRGRDPVALDEDWRF